MPSHVSTRIARPAHIDAHGSPVIEFIIPGRPVPYARTRPRPGGGFIDDERYAQWKHDARIHVMTQRPQRLKPDVPVIAEIVVESDAIHVSIAPWEGERMRPKHIRGDLDNHVKAVLDTIQRAGRQPFHAGPINDDRDVIAINARFRP